MENQKVKAKANEKIAMEVSKNSIIVNVILSLFKLFAGVFAHSGAMISDAVHSASDVFSTIIVIIGVKLSGKEADEKHQYGHERLECVAAIILAVILLATGLGIGFAGISKIYEGNYGQLAVPGILALIAAIASIVTKEGMYWYTRNAAKKINSSALMADAWHHRSDALSSIGSLVGIAGARLGFPVFDPLASVVICLFIVKVSFDIFFDAMGKMTDESCDEVVENQMKQVVLDQRGVEEIDELRTRKFGDRVYVDIEISAQGTMSLNDSHAIAEEVHHAIECNFKTVKHCMVHVNPFVSISGTDSPK